ncbi:hypothetical protein [Corynebacterium aquatimens]|uniref:Alkaline shock response membrane anchor protein AmaP n=1 Tax=Corynebacterium aquatimens TaxID=1190508 RepID=A0A931GY07_9CORY|nr:hypothetical protein [Corynebacterium aquatimens]MBG6122984.1 hypothetical protein [Corynebacterium aquatimens]WJY66682.1 hypothetical protein CAQUA_09975 [Corynebacterium aquatimens]
MSKGLEVFDRILIFILGLGLLALGLIPLGLRYDIPWWSDVTATLDRKFIGSIPDAGWYGTALIIACVLLAFLGFWLILANIQNRGFNRRALIAERPDGEIGGGDTLVNVNRLAAAACSYAETLEPIVGATQNVAFIGDRPTATFTITARPDYDMNTVFSTVENLDADFRDAVDTMDIDTVFKVHFDRIAP